MNIVFLLISAAVLILVYFAIKANKARQLKYIEQYFFHKGIRHKLSQKYPQLTEQQLDMVFSGLEGLFSYLSLGEKPHGVYAVSSH